MSLSKFLQAARISAESVTTTALPEGHPGWVLFFSLCHGNKRAHVHIASGNSFEQAWSEGAEALQKWSKKQSRKPLWLRVDVVDQVRAVSWEDLQREFGKTKRNYFGCGLSLDSQFTLAMLPQELCANAVLYEGNKNLATPNVINLASYGRQRFGQPLQWPQRDDETIWCFTTSGVFTDGTQTLPLENRGLNAGYRRIDNWPGEALPQVIDSATSFLAEQVKSSGEFYYGWFPCFDRPIDSYNALRHASSTYALLEGWEKSQQPQQMEAVERSLRYLTGKLIHTRKLPDGSDADFLVDTGNEIKLGGNAVCILAMAKYTELTGDERYLAQMERLANGIGFMQTDKKSFVHVLNFPSLSVKAEQRIIYYDGEAAFALMRLYGITRNPRWLEIVERAFDYFIENKHWQAHDHWLSYCVNELTLYRPEERYFKFGLDNVRDYLNFVLTRITTFPTLLELMMAAQKMIVRMAADERHAHLLFDFDLNKFYEALEFRARYLLNGFFWPELAMFFKNPERIVGSFFIRHHSFRVRIDDVEHYLSGYVAYHNYLRQPSHEQAAAVKASVAAKALAARGGPRKSGDPRVLFLCENLRNVGNGIEVATLQRARLFKEYLGVVPTILISSFNPALEETTEAFKAAGKLPAETQVMSIYQWLSPLCDSKKLAPLAAIPQGVLLRSTGAKDAPLRVLQYALPGREGELSFEDYVDSRQRIVLRKHYTQRQQSSLLSSIEVGQPNGEKLSWRSDAAFVAEMAIMCLDSRTEWHFVVDKTRPWSEFIRRAPHLQCNGTLTSLFHSTHLLADGKLKAGYARVLDSEKNIDQLVVLTDGQQQALTNGGFASQRLRVIPNHIDNPQATKKISKKASKNVLYVARYAPEKRHDLLIRVFEKVLKAVPDAQLHTWGVGPLRAGLIKQVQDKDLTQNIHINGFSNNIEEIHREACCAVLCSDQEGFSLSGLEALAYSTPLVSFDVDYGPRNLLSNFKAGVLVEDGNEQALADTLIDLLEHPGKLRTMRGAAARSAARFFTPVVAEKWRQWWDDMRQLAAEREQQALPASQERAAIGQ
ncbi:glycosyltransferase [Pantoea coffeiphila]|uniref:glycosyltransferase n=1 Tax=Pantoea coffeiphila TaxID=1465635 RepID=UPI0019617A2C|nr:glycosyltransferase [Pantoea coffeiphila]MBM7342481.1 glycosyltransferase involved in cell wall biosynthesis [Pantoea coffeiphila]